MATDSALIDFVPGVYDLDEDEYHAHPALSSSGARALLPPSCPAIFHHERENGRPPKREFDLGHAAHKLVLGVGPELHVVGADNYRTNAVKQERDEAYARGAVPLIPEEFDTVQAMAAALRRHKRADDLFADGGVAEQSLFWRDPETGVPCRARPDWMTPQRIVDYKTTVSAEPGAVAKSASNYGYHIQQAFYTAGAAALDLVPEDVEFLFVFQSKTPPYLVTVVEWDQPALRIGYERMRLALEIFRDCSESGVWPGYSDDIETISLPSWVVRAHERGLWS